VSRVREGTGEEGPSCLSVALWLRILDPPLPEPPVLDPPPVSKHARQMCGNFLKVFDVQ